MLKIRLTRTGKKKQPNYRVVVANKDAKRDGRIVERIGHYNPLVDPAEYRIQEDRALYWLSVGAQPTDAVRRLLEKQGTMARLQRYHAGEPMETLVAEFTGVSALAKVEATKAEKQAEAVVAEAIVEAEAKEIAAEVVEEAVVEEAVEAIEEEIVAEVVEEAVAETVEEEIVAEAVEETVEEEIVAEAVEEAVAEAVAEEEAEEVAEIAEEAAAAEEAEAADDANSETDEE